MDDILPEITWHHWGEALVAVAIVLAGLVLAWAIARFLPRLARWVVPNADSNLTNAIAEQVRGPAAALVLVLAIFIAVELLSHLDPYEETLQRVWAAATLLLAFALAWRATGAVFAWLEFRSAARKSLPILRRVAKGIVLLVGGVMVLDEFGVAISPLLAGIGIGGIAVALAVQPILANIFSGSYLLSDGSIGVDDFIELEGGPTGWVEDIGMRATRIRTFDNNLVLIPNAKLADATVTNFDTADPPAGAAVICGVAYKEDLGQVEDLVIEELGALTADLPEADSAFEPFLRFTAFGESNIDFLMKLYATNRRDVSLVQHEMIKRIHARFAVEGIEISLPARRLFLENDEARGLDPLTSGGDSAEPEG
jgi:small-conductance mechanosensitive channel